MHQKLWPCCDANILLGVTVTKPFESTAGLSKPFRPPTMAQGILKEPSIPRIPPDQTALSNHSRSPQEEKPATNRSIPIEPMVDDHIIHEDTESKSRYTLPCAPSYY